jgi:hypothetical protein
VPAKDVIVYGFKYDDYYADYGEPFIFTMGFPSGSKSPEVDVEPGQTVTGVIVQLPPTKDGMLHVLVRDADTKKLVHGIFERICPESYPKNCATGSNQSDFVSIFSWRARLSFEIKADDGRHETWHYRNPKTGSRYYVPKPGKTEKIEVYLGKKKNRKTWETWEQLSR